MSDESRTSVPAPVVEEQIEFTLVELSRACCVDIEQITALVVEGVLEPETTGSSDPASLAAAAGEAMITQWRFRGSALRRARLALRLSHDLEMNAPGVALALDLMDEIAELRARLHRLGR